MTATDLPADPDSDQAPSAFWLHDLPGHRIRRLHQRLVAEFNQLVDADPALAGLTNLQFAALAAIEHRPDCDQATVARLIACDKVTVGKLIDRLDERGWVARRTDPNDRRARALRLSPAGAAILARIRPRVLAAPLVELPGLARDQRRRLLAMLARLTMPYEG
ncbi:MAG: MarR family winged helix-turn-helix transcriptional regulator [Lautropia sp.]